MRTIFFGTPEFALPSLRKLLDENFDVVLVVTQPDKLSGRGHKLSQPPVKDFATSRGIPVIQPKGIRSQSFIDELAGFKPDVITVVAYGKIIPPQILALPPMGCINVHGSLLPRYRGAAPIQRALMNGEKETGITTMFMDEGLDTGDILLQREIEIGPDDNSHTLGTKLSVLGASLLTETLKRLSKHLIFPTPQSGESSYAPPLRKEEGRIRWDLPAGKICDLIRGTYPWPGAYSFLKGERISFLKANSVSGEARSVPGRIEKAREGQLLVGTGKDFLSVLELKPEGRRAMQISEFLSGRARLEGEFFELQ